VPLLVRTWNLFHGNASPPLRRSYLREMVELACADRPDVLCLQEIPVWAIGRIGAWGRMREYSAVARRGLHTARLAGWATRLHNGLLRSAIAGQANAILVGPGRDAEDLGSERLTGRGHEQRVCQAIRLDGRIVVANMHLSSAGEEQRHELARARAFAESHARPGETVVLAGDLNVREPGLDDYSAPGPGIDHILVRGVAVGPLVVWSEERRMQNGLVLSDHPPVELRLE